jgi:ribbon-helix-helix CopG family protein
MRRMRSQPKPDIDSVGIDAVHARGMETAKAVSSLQWVTARLPGDLVREIDAHAKRMGTKRSDAIRDCLGIGIEAIGSRDGIPAGRADELLSALEGVRLTLDLIGPPTFGMLRLLVHWATRDRSLKVDEDELLAEVRATGADDWEQAVADAERDLVEGAKAQPSSAH